MRHQIAKAVDDSLAADLTAPSEQQDLMEVSQQTILAVESALGSELAALDHAVVDRDTMLIPFCGVRSATD